MKKILSGCILLFLCISCSNDNNMTEIPENIAVNTVDSVDITVDTTEDTVDTTEKNNPTEVVAIQKKNANMENTSTDMQKTELDSFEIELSSNKVEYQPGEEMIFTIDYKDYKDNIENLFFKVNDTVEPESAAIID